jgi:hypothetical protein
MARRFGVAWQRTDRFDVAPDSRFSSSVALLLSRHPVISPFSKALSSGLERPRIEDADQPALAAILDEYRQSMHNPKSGVIFHTGYGRPMAMDKLAQNVVRPAIEAIKLPWYGWHGFRRAIASNLYALGADDKVVQRVLRLAKPHVTRERYIKVFDPAVLDAMRKMQAPLEELGRGQQLASRFLQIGGKLLKARRGEVAERLNAAVC